MLFGVVSVAPCSGVNFVACLEYIVRVVDGEERDIRAYVPKLDRVVIAGTEEEVLLSLVKL